jgi:Reverse transcriptase (RNA-dependent DNA polymerase)
MCMEVLAALQSDLNIDEAIVDEWAYKPRLLPPRWSDLSLAGGENFVASWLKSLVRKGFEVDQEEILVIRKLGRGGRPCALLGMKERLLYRAATDVVRRTSTVVLDRSSESYSRFLLGPLEEQNCKFVVKLDVAAYYQYIDHERLLDEVVSQTGDDLAISLAIEVLQSSSSRRFGLPQLNTASDFLSEIYIGPMHRQLARTGIPVWRYADDFRLACRSYGEALQALEEADNAAREIGLVLNESKSWIQKTTGYRDGLSHVLDRERELLSDLEIEPESLDYDDFMLAVGRLGRVGGLDENDDLEPAEPSHGSHHLAASKSVLDRWLEEDEDDESQRQADAHVTAKLLGRALRILGGALNPIAIGHATAMLVHEPSLTPAIAKYLNRLSSSDPDSVRMALDEVTERNVLNAWQRLWLANSAAQLPDSRKDGHVSWLLSLVETDVTAVAAESLLTLARRHLITASGIIGKLDRLGPTHRPTGLLALCAIGAESEALAQSSSQLDRLRIKWGLTNLQ